MTGASPEAADTGRRPGAARLLYLLPVLAFLGLALLFLVRLFAGDPSRLPSALIGRSAPDFALPAVPGLLRDGAPVPGLARGDLLAPPGQVTVVNVWASWCGPCRVEHPQLMGLMREPGLRIVGVNYKDNPENARRFLGQLGNPFERVGADTGGRAAIDWGVYGVPETFVVSADGRIIHKHVGPLTPETMPGFLAAARRAP